MTTNHLAPHAPPDSSLPLWPAESEPPTKRSAWARRQAKLEAQAQSTDARRTRRIPINELV